MTDVVTEEKPTTTNALSILLSALPSDVVSDFESEINTLLGQTTSSPLSQETKVPTSGPASNSSPIPTSPSSEFISSTSSALSSTVSSTPSPSTLMTVTNRPSSTTTSSTSTTPTSNAGPSAEGSHQLRHAPVAGIVTGVLAGIVLILLAGFFLWRRRQQGQSPFGPRGSQRSKASTKSKKIFPEVAWLYDPKTSPSHAGSPLRPESRHHPTTNLIPPPREGTVEMAESTSHSPPTQRPTSPLLTPDTIGLARDYSPPPSPAGAPRRSDSRSPPPVDNPRSASNSPPVGRKSRGSMGRDWNRPLAAIWEEGGGAPRPSSDGLLRPGAFYHQRYSA